jgi:hypothetical protein
LISRHFVFTATASYRVTSDGVDIASFRIDGAASYLVTRDGVDIALFRICIDGDGGGGAQVCKSYYAEPEIQRLCGICQVGARYRVRDALVRYAMR